MERLKQQEAEEEEFRKRMLEKFAEDERLEQMNAQKRRMRQMEHKREVERLLDERRAMYEAEKEAELDEQREEEKRAAALRDLIEQERRRILQVRPEERGVGWGGGQVAREVEREAVQSRRCGRLVAEHRG
eukprot:447219-Rhodomonas_salina.1